MLKKQTTEKTKEKEKAYLATDTYNEIRNNYYNYWGEIDNMLQKISVSKNNENDANQTIIQYAHNLPSFKLPRIELPKFSGEYKEWRNFQRLFNSLVHENKSLNSVQKFSYLQTNVVGKAKELIDHLELEETNYTEAMKLLTERYDHKRMLVFLERYEMFNQPVIQKETTQSLQKLLDTTTECLLQLKRLGEPIEHWDSILIYTLQEKIPKSIKEKWHMELGKRTDVPKYTEFKEFLYNRFRSSEMMDLTSIDKSNRTFHIQSLKPKEPYRAKCILCKTTNHIVSKCPKFLKSTLQARQDITRQNKLCINCLRSSHTLEACYSMKTCYHCHKRHHTLLHIHKSTNNNTTRGSNNNINIRQNSGSEGNSNENTPSTSQQALSRNFLLNSSKNVKLLGTALVNLYNSKGQFRNIRALIDPCSEDTYITNSLVRSLNLTKILSPTTISVLGDNSGRECLYRVVCKINSLNIQRSV